MNPKILVSMTGKIYIVTAYEELGDDFFLAHEKFDITEQFINIFILFKYKGEIKK